MKPSSSGSNSIFDDFGVTSSISSKTTSSAGGSSPWDDFGTLGQPSVKG